MTVEHLLLAIVDTPKVREVLKSCGADTPKLKTELKQFIDQTTPRLPPGEDRDVQPTLGFQRVLQRAVFHVQSSGKKEVTVANVLVAIFSEKQSHAAYLLSMQDVSRLDVVNFIAHGLSKAGGEERSDREDSGVSGDAERDGESGGSALEKYATNLNDAARKGKIDPLIGRKLEVERTIEILCRRRKNNPLYVGEAGAFAVEIAHSRETGFQIPFRGRDSLHGAKGLRLGDDRRRASLVFGLEHDVGVAVNQSGQDRVGGKVDYFRAVWNAESGSDLFDTLTAHDDDGVWCDRAVHGVDQPPALDGGDWVRLGECEW